MLCFKPSIWFGFRIPQPRESLFSPWGHPLPCSPPGILQRFPLLPPATMQGDLNNHSTPRKTEQLCWNHGITELLSLEKPSKITQSNCYHSSAKSTTDPCPLSSTSPHFLMFKSPLIPFISSYGWLLLMVQQSFQNKQTNKTPHPQSKQQTKCSV